MVEQPVRVFIVWKRHLTGITNMLKLQRFRLDSSVYFVFCARVSFDNFPENLAFGSFCFKQCHISRIFYFFLSCHFTTFL